jgi:hypothetical protein
MKHGRDHPLRESSARSSRRTVRTAATSASTRTPPVVIDKENNPRGTRIFGAVARELPRQELHEDRFVGFAEVFEYVHLSWSLVRSMRAHEVQVDK